MDVLGKLFVTRSNPKARVALGLTTECHSSFWITCSNKQLPKYIHISTDAR